MRSAGSSFSRSNCSARKCAELRSLYSSYLMRSAGSQPSKPRERRPGRQFLTHLRSASAGVTLSGSCAMNALKVRNLDALCRAGSVSCASELQGFRNNLLRVLRGTHIGVPHLAASLRVCLRSWPPAHEAQM